MISVSLSLFRIVLWPSMWLILEIVPWAFEKGILGHCVFIIS